jgi:chorismate lyase/3-hydroxybenzoate synthase
MMQQQQSSVCSHPVFPTPLSVLSASAGKLSALLRRDDVLMAVNFSGGTELDRNDPRLVRAGLPVLGESAAAEVWCGAGAVSCHRLGRISWSEDGVFLFGHLLLQEAPAVALDASIAAAYAEIGTFLQASAYPCAFRFWHYIPGINRVENGMERYRAFCVGRHAALSQQRGFERTLPAASTVGTDAPGLLISFAAGKVPPLQVENPRQLSAFHYPAVHGPRSPLFSRAVSMNWRTDGQQLFLSGTASIVGHETRHTGDVAAQADETCRNIRAILDYFGRESGRAVTRPVTCAGLRVYLRYPRHLKTVQSVLSAKLDMPDSITFLHGEICRAGLLLEVEGVFERAR